MGCPNKKSRAMRKGFFVCVLCILFFGTSPLSAQWWNPFAPKDYEECAESAAREITGNNFRRLRRLGIHTRGGAIIKVPNILSNQVSGENYIAPWRYNRAEHRHENRWP